MTMSTTRVGFVGLGNIGKPMALRLAAADELGVDVPLAREALPRLGKGLGLS